MESWITIKQIANDIHAAKFKDIKSSLTFISSANITNKHAHESIFTAANIFHKILILFVFTK